MLYNNNNTPVAANMASQEQCTSTVAFKFKASTKSIVKSISSLTTTSEASGHVHGRNKSTHKEPKTVSTSNNSVQHTTEYPPAPLRRQLSRHDKSSRDIMVGRRQPSKKLSKRFSILSKNKSYRRRMDTELLPVLTEKLNQCRGLKCELPKGTLLALSKMGTTAVVHHDNTFCTVLEVPPRGESFFLYSTVWKSSEPSVALMRKALELNYLCQGTNGATLGLDPSCDMERDGMEYTLSYSLPLGGLSVDEFCQVVMHFMHTTKEVHDKLAEVGSL